MKIEGGKVDFFLGIIDSQVLAVLNLFLAGSSNENPSADSAHLILSPQKARDQGTEIASDPTASHAATGRRGCIGFR